MADGMRRAFEATKASREIPAADPLVGYRKRVERACDDLVAALNDANAAGVPMAEFRDRLRSLSGIA